jgi:hypothetical protein
MTLVGDRAAIKAALNTVAGVTGYAYRPATPRSGAAWPLLGAMDRADARSFAITWNVYLMLPVSEIGASAWIDAHTDALVDALEEVGYVDRMEPVNIGGSEDQPIFGLLITMRSE